VRKILGRAMMVGKAATLCVGLAVVLALTAGVATDALAANGKPFLLGKSNVATKVSTLVNRGVGPALGLKVGADQAPITVNPEAGTATGLSADELDGKDSVDFAQGRGRILDGTATISNGATNHRLLTLPKLGNVSVDCNAAAGQMTVRYKPATPADGGDGSAHRVWKSDGSTVTMDTVNYEDAGATVTGGPIEQFTFQVQKYNTRATITVSTSSPTTPHSACDVMGQALMTGAA
jgi:hypothetical protein